MDFYCFVVLAFIFRLNSATDCVRCSEYLVTGPRGVPDDKLTASTFYPNGEILHDPKYGKLHTYRSNNIGGWSAKSNNDAQFIQAEFDTVKLIRAVLTQGRSTADQWVTSYSVSYSIDGITWWTVKDVNRYTIIFPANNDRSTIVTNTLPECLEAKYVRLHPRNWHNHISLRFDVIGCSESGCPKFCKFTQTCEEEDSGCSDCVQGYYGRRCQHRMECLFHVKGKEYRGFINKTKTGINCQRWNSRAPHNHHLFGEGNFCRNPDNENTPWCYTTDPNKRYEGCIVPMCDTMCLSPPLTSSGVDVLNPPSHGFVVGYRAIIGCMEGFEADGKLATVTFTCQSNKKWTRSPLPMCNITKCQRPTIDNGSISNSTLKPVYKYNDKLTIVCDEGYTTQGSAVSTCQANRSWRPLPNCTKINCRDIDRTANLLILNAKEGEYSYKDKVSFACEEGYKLSHTNELECQANRLWDKDQPICTEICKGLSTLIWIAITVGSSLATGLMFVTVIIICRFRHTVTRNKGNDIIAMKKMKASLDYNVTGTNKNDDQHVYNITE